MRSMAQVLTGALLSCALLAGAATPVTEPVDPVVGHALAELEIPGEVTAVLWTRRTTHYTLQISRRTAGTGLRGRVARQTPASAPAGEKDDVQVWLLRADGTHISPLSAAEDAVAVAMQFNGRFLIEKLPAL